MPFEYFLTFLASLTTTVKVILHMWILSYCAYRLLEHV